MRTIWGPSLVAVGLEPYQAAVDANLNTVAFLRQALAEIAAAQA